MCHANHRALAKRFPPPETLIISHFAGWVDGCVTTRVEEFSHPLPVRPHIVQTLVCSVLLTSCCHSASNAAKDPILWMHRVCKILKRELSLQLKLPSKPSELVSDFPLVSTPALSLCFFYLCGPFSRHTVIQQHLNSMAKTCDLVHIGSGWRQQATPVSSFFLYSTVLMRWHIRDRRTIPSASCPRQCHPASDVS